MLQCIRRGCLTPAHIAAVRLAPGLDIARDGVGAALRLDLRIQLGTAK
jgi:hypothetical protein